MQPGTSLGQAIRALLEPTAKAAGPDFFRGLARGIAKSLGVKAGFVGTLVPDRRAVYTQAVWWGDSFIENFEYPLPGTPCENVIGRAVCFFPERVQELFPGDEMLVQMGIQSYLGVPINNARGAPLGILVALHDASTPHHNGIVRDELEPIFALFADRAGLEMERLAAHERLQASEARYRLIVESTRDGVWIIGTDGRTTFVNEQMCRMIGWTADEMVGRPLHDFIASARHAEAEANMARRARGISERHEFCFKRKDGSELWTILSTSVLTDDAGTYSGALALVADLTEIRGLEQKIVQSQKLESLGLLAGGVAHDFNNLLVGILGNVGVALAELPANAEVRSVLVDAEAAGRRAADLTRQMLAYSGRGRFVIERVNLNRVVKELAQLLGAVISKQATFRFELADGLPDVDGDQMQLTQIVMNLITNASDALEGRDGVITVASGVLAADQAYLSSTYLDDRLPPGDYVWLDIKDTGVGMDRETQTRIFDPFFTTKFTGRGLGLAAVLGILRGHHGAVHIDSTLGKGTCFRILLPRATSEVTAVTPGGVAAVPRQESKLVLIADDEPLVRQVAQRVLERRGFRVLLAEDGRQALATFVANATEIDLVILDLTMPGLGGDEVFRLIREVRPTARIVLSSGYDEASAQARLGRDGLAGFLPKPWSPEQLVHIVEATFAQPTS